MAIVFSLVPNVKEEKVFSTIIAVKGAVSHKNKTPHALIFTLVLTCRIPGTYTYPTHNFTKQTNYCCTRYIRSGCEFRSIHSFKARRWNLCVSLEPARIQHTISPRGRTAIPYLEVNSTLWKHVQPCFSLVYTSYYSDLEQHMARVGEEGRGSLGDDRSRVKTYYSNNAVPRVLQILHVLVESFI